MFLGMFLGMFLVGLSLAVLFLAGPLLVGPLLLGLFLLDLFLLDGGLAGMGLVVVLLVTMSNDLCQAFVGSRPPRVSRIAHFQPAGGLAPPAAAAGMRGRHERPA